MEKRLLTYCISGILLGILVVSLPIFITPFEPGTQYHEAGDGGVNNLSDTAVNVSLIVSVGLVFASSTFLIVKRYLMK